MAVTVYCVVIFIAGEVTRMNTLQRTLVIVGIALVGLGVFLAVKHKMKHKRKGKVITLILLIHCNIATNL